MRRRSIAILVLTISAGVGIGYQAYESGLGLAPGVGTWLSVLGLGGLVVMVLSAPSVSGVVTAATDLSGWVEFRRELRRSRRGGRPLTLLRIAGEALPSIGPDGAGDLATRSRRLGLHLRLVDRTWVDGGSIYVLLPESPRSAANVLIERLRRESPGQIPEHVQIATFPDDGLTSGAIIAAVNDGVIEPVPTPIRPALNDLTDVAAFGLDEELSVGEALRP